jgi:hypothetical protein
LPQQTVSQFLKPIRLYARTHSNSARTAAQKLRLAYVFARGKRGRSRERGTEKAGIWGHGSRVRDQC